MNQLPLSYSHLSAEDPIKELHLTNRSFNALTGAGIWTVGELFDFIKSDNLDTIRALGTKSINEIQSKLAQVKIHDNSDVEAKLDTDPNRDYIYLSQEDSLEKLDLSKRSFNALTRTGIRTVEDAAQLVESGSLFHIRGLGTKCVLEIKEKLAQVRILNTLEVEANPDSKLDQSLLYISSEDSISKLNLTLRSFNTLARSDIQTVGEAVELIESRKLQTIREFGAECILEIVTRLTQVSISGDSEVGNQQSSDVLSWFVEGILRDSEVEGITLKNDIPDRVVEWQSQFVSKQLSKELLHEDAKIAGKSIREWCAETEKKDSNQAYEELSIILGASINICEEIEHFLSYLPGQNSIIILLFRYGLEPKTLQQTGVELGITRERVRQLENEIKNTTISISNLKSMPILLRMQSALLIARDLGLDITYENWTQRIRSSGLVGDWTSQDFADTDAIEVMIAISKLATECEIPWLRTPENLQYAIELAASGTSNISARIPHTRKTLPNEIRRLINGHTRNSGGVYAKWLSDESGIELEEIKIIMQVLGYTQLCEGWYVHDSYQVSYHDVFHHGLRKMFQYCGPLNIDDVCAGLRHVLSRKHTVLSKRREFPVPPPVVMDKIIRMSGYKYEDHLYYWDGASDEGLNSGETVIMNCFNRIGSVTHHSELVDAFMESDRSFPLLHSTLRRSPLFDTVDFGLYKLRGRDVTYQDIERAKAVGKRQSLNLDEEYDTSGNIILRMTLGSVAVGSGTIYCEQFRDLSGNWPCRVNGVEAGVLIAIENEFRHLRESFELLGCKPGNRLKFIFNMWNRTVEIELTGENAQV